MRMPGSPASRKKSATTDHPHAASVPTEIRVSIVAAPCFRFIHAALWNGQPPQRTTGVASWSESHCQLSNCSGSIIASSSTGQRQQCRDDQPSPQRRGRVVLRRRRLGAPCSVALIAGRLDRGDQILGRDAQRVEVDGRVLGRIVDRRLDAVELVQPLLDPRRAGRAGHPLDRELEPFGQGRAHVATSVNGTVWTLPPCLNWKKRA